MEKSPNWSKAWEGIQEFSPLDKNSMFAKLFDNFQNFAKAENKSAIEIGCFPGHFIGYLGQLGFITNGIDTYERVNLLETWFKSRDIKVGSFLNTPLDDFILAEKKKFDFVLSLGFIEHFTNFCDIIYKHALLCNLGGYVVIGAPNFASPLQRALHEVLDKDNLNDHVLSAMYPRTWSIFLSAIGFKIDYAGSLGGFGFWSDTRYDDAKIRILQSAIPQTAGFMQSLGTEFNKDESSYGIVIAKKIHGHTFDSSTIADLSTECIEVAKQLDRRDAALAKQNSSFIKYLIS